MLGRLLVWMRRLKGWLLTVMSRAWKIAIVSLRSDWYDVETYQRSVLVGMLVAGVPYSVYDP
jgi:hypothetical protein